MNSILQQLVNDLMVTDYCHKRICPELEQEAEEKITIMNNWIDRAFSNPEEAHNVSRIIWDAMSAGQEWMMASGIVIGMSLMGECMRAQK